MLIDILSFIVILNEKGEKNEVQKNSLWYGS